MLLSKKRQEEPDKESLKKEERKGGGELSLRSARGKAFGCCSKLSCLSTMDRKGRKSAAWVG